MKTCKTILLLPCLLLASVSDIGAIERETINGLTYERIDGRWFVYDTIGEKWEIAPGTIRIKFHQGLTSDEFDQWATANNLDRDPCPPSGTGFHRYRYSSAHDPLALLKSVLATPFAEAGFLDTFLKFQGAPNDTFYGNQWNLSKIEIERAWDITVGDSNVTIAIIDGGSQYDHEDLIDSAWSNPEEIPGNGIDDDNDAVWNNGVPLVDDIVGWDFADNDNDPRPGKINPERFDTPDLHGTPCAGIAGAARNNLKGIAGVAGGCRIVHIRAQTNDYAIDALKYCWNKGVDVVSMSWTTNDPIGLFAEQIDSAYANDVILVAAAGNSGLWVYPIHLPNYPANHPKVIGVGATTNNDVRQPYSSWGGPGVELMAPGGRYPDAPLLDLWVTDNEGTFGGGTPYYDNNPTTCQCPPDNPEYFQYFAGTSACAPAVAGVAALVRSHEPGLTNAEIFDRLRTAAIDLGPAGFDDEYGYGRIDAYRSLTKWGTITANTTWSDTVYVSGDVVVASGVTLTISPGTTVRIATDDNEHKGKDTDRIEFRIAGALNATGTGASPIVFESWTPTATDDWVGFQFLTSSSSGTFVNCKIRRAEKAIESWAALTIKHTRIEDCGAGVSIYAGPTLVQTCTLMRPGAYGIKLKAGTTTVRNTSVHNTTGTACQVDSVASLTARTSKFRASDKGLHVVGNRTVNIDSTCAFNSNVIGIHCYNTSTATTLKSSAIDSCTSNGIFCDGGTWSSIEKNTIRYNTSAIFCNNGASPIIKSNTVTSNTNGITTAEGSNPDIGHPGTGNNTIGSTTFKYVRNFDTGLSVSAQNNCWNGDTTVPCGPPANKIAGLVDTSAPNCCPGGSGAPEYWPPPPEPDEGPFVVTDLIAIVPNPFNPSTTIHYSVAAPGGAVEISIYDVAGRLVRRLVDAQQAPGIHQVVWDGTNAAGEGVSSAPYFVKLSAGDVERTMKILFLK
jgi:subtilisin family serine protease